MNGDIPSSVAIGGIGGSGTRVAAALLEILGYYLGDDLNDELDNLWFTLLFKRRSVLLESDSDIRNLVRLFLERMTSAGELPERDRARVLALAEQDRLQHPRDWLLKRAQSFVAGRSSKRADQPWAWKEPNAHIVIERFFSILPNLQYIHINRHPLNMSVSANQNQLQNWGPLFLNMDVSIAPRLSLAYWCMVHRRMADFARTWPSRVRMIDFDALCAEPDAHFATIAEFLGLLPPDNAVARFRELIVKPVSTSRYIGLDLGQFDPKNLDYVQEIGYPVT
jgi:hypothetical protein